MDIGNFFNTVYLEIETRIQNLGTNENDSVEKIIRDIREASLYGKIESSEEIHLMDLLNLEKNEDIDDGYRQVIDETTGGIDVTFEEKEIHDMSYLDDYEEEEEEKEEGFLGFLNND